MDSTAEPGGTAFRHEMPPRADTVTALVDGLEAYAGRVGLSPRATGRLVVVVDEIVANVVMHGAGATLLRVAAWRDGDALHLAVEDDGPSFDPLSAPPPHLDSDLEQRDAGGLGVHLLRTMTREVAYRRDGALNRLTAVLDAR